MTEWHNILVSSYQVTKITEALFKLAIHVQAVPKLKENKYSAVDDLFSLRTDEYLI